MKSGHHDRHKPERRCSANWHAFWWHRRSYCASPYCRMLVVTCLGLSKRPLPFGTADATALRCEGARSEGTHPLPSQSTPVTGVGSQGRLPQGKDGIELPQDGARVKKPTAQTVVPSLRGSKFSYLA